MLDATDGRGVDVAFDAVSGDVTLQTFRCMAFNGRHILAGFASGIEQEDEGLVPRPVLFGNFSLVGVCHAYVDDPVVFKRLSGFNFPAHRDGERLHAELLALFAAGKLRADRRPGGAVHRTARPRSTRWSNGRPSAVRSSGCRSYSSAAGSMPAPPAALLA